MNRTPEVEQPHVGIARAIDLINEVLAYSPFCPVHFAFDELEQAKEILANYSHKEPS